MLIKQYCLANKRLTQKNSPEKPPRKQFLIFLNQAELTDLMDSDSDESKAFFE